MKTRETVTLSVLSSARKVLDVHVVRTLGRVRDDDPALWCLSLLVRRLERLQRRPGRAPAARHAPVGIVIVHHVVCVERVVRQALEYGLLDEGAPVFA